jgi:hypothetical protein
MLNLARLFMRHMFSTYVARIDKKQLDFDLASAKVSKQKSWSLAFKERAIASHLKRSRSEAYVCIHPSFSWITVCGNRGDYAKPPFIPIGGSHTASSAGSGRPNISQAPPVPLENSVKPSTGRQREHVQKALAVTLQALASASMKPTFSVSLLEFALRAAFVIARSKADFATEDSVELAEQLISIDKADPEQDVLSLLDQDQQKDNVSGGKQGRVTQIVAAQGHHDPHDQDELDNPAVVDNFTRGCRHIEELELTRRLPAKSQDDDGLGSVGGATCGSAALWEAQAHCIPGYTAYKRHTQKVAEERRSEQGLLRKSSEGVLDPYASRDHTVQEPAGHPAFKHGGEAGSSVSSFASGFLDESATACPSTRPVVLAMRGSFSLSVRTARSNTCSNHLCSRRA